MKAVTAREMQRIDIATIGDYGVPGEVLMGLAGKAVFDRMREFYPGHRSVAVFCGTGNNGGDGFVVAHLLHNAGVAVHIYCTGPDSRLSKSAALYCGLCRKEGIHVTLLDERGLVVLDLTRFDCAVDALFGTGFRGPASGVPALCIEAINSWGGPVVSIDLPSGLTSDGDIPDGPVVRSTHTVTIGLPKISLVTFPGMEYAGTVSVADIGFPRLLTESEDLSAELVDWDYCEKRLRRFEPGDVNKSQRGHLLLLGGFPGMEGAIVMTALAALRMGVGYISLCTDELSRRAIAGSVPELMTTGLDITLLEREPDRFFTEMDRLFTARRHDALVVGPGMGRSDAAAGIFGHIMHSLPGYGIRRVLIDGDGLYHLSGYLEKEIIPGDVEFLLTPHLMEASRLLGIPVDQVRDNRFYRARQCAEKTGAVTLLKGPGTVISEGTRTLINTTGNPLLATAGSGDILSGIIGALLLREIPVADAAAIGAYLHGRAADRFSSGERRSMRATDLLDHF
ncbi:MAG: NAD(P)H-hydrate dehydratase [Spirochaetes bacterium]|nr:NAD(P)H-hydrate dehydratase [Spirochaetota bacterium]